MQFRNANIFRQLSPSGAAAGDTVFDSMVVKYIIFNRKLENKIHLAATWKLLIYLGIASD